MCGIAGIVGGSVTREALEASVASMSRAVAHRGPDGDGLWSDPGTPACIAQRRLAIVDLGDAGRQPMVSISGRWVVVFNGEIYNHRELRAALTQRGVAYEGHSDTRALVEAIDAWGFESALARTNGMFALAAWDRVNRRLLVARDRLGEKPLYWSLDHGSFAFASELRGVIAGQNSTPAIDERAVSSMLHWSFVPHPYTAREGVRQLAPGHLIEVTLDAARHAHVEERVWWDLASIVGEAHGTRSSMTIDQAADHLVELLTDSVRIRLEADVPLGAFLSGGIDSSIVAAVAQNLLGGDLRTFTVRMPHVGFDESEHAAVVARYLGTDHRVVELDRSDALRQITQLTQVYDEPFADPSMLPTTLLCKAARQELTVCLGGDGGDELFGGYNRHIFGSMISRRTRLLPRSLRRALGRALLAPSPQSIDRAAARAAGFLPRALRLRNPGDKVQKAASLLVDGRDAWGSLAQVWPARALLVEPYEPVIPPTSAGLGEIERMMLADTSAVLPDQMLVKVDRASMAAPIEVRVPLLDHRIVEWSWSVPLALKVSGGSGKAVLRHVAGRLLPREIVDRPKMGFDPPLGEWLRDDLRGWAEARLDRVASMPNPIIDPSAVRSTWAEHVHGERNWDYRIWGLLNIPQDLLASE